MSDNKNVNQDKGLQGNEKIEQAIAALQQEATQEMLAPSISVVIPGMFFASIFPAILPAKCKSVFDMKWTLSKAVICSILA